ncbi:nucleoside kinase [Dactylosporangium sucinum]|uniref:Nucleoside kinase n=2 Tax=Dactylosporangium sucinum TaxID=1424081 RepID=A0A917WV19_9ACTN|nr:nucleoside kinase [Dactylosporangium sucinum]
MHYCERCADPTVMAPEGDEAVCPVCGERRPARRLPAFVVTGASAAGKTTVLPHLVAELPECVVFDVDWLIGPFRRACSFGEVDWPAFRDAWLAVAHGAAQGGRSAVLLGPFVPAQLADLPALRWQSAVHFAVLDCADEVRRARLEARPAWRERDVDSHLAFAAHLRSTLSPVLRTDGPTPEATARSLAAWVRGLL